MGVLHTFPVKGTQKYTFDTELQMFAKKIIGYSHLGIMPGACPPLSI